MLKDELLPSVEQRPQCPFPISQVIIWYSQNTVFNFLSKIWEFLLSQPRLIRSCLGSSGRLSHLCSRLLKLLERQFGPRSLHWLSAFKWLFFSKLWEDCWQLETYSISELGHLLGFFWPVSRSMHGCSFIPAVYRELLGLGFVLDLFNVWPYGLNCVQSVHFGTL